MNKYAISTRLALKAMAERIKRTDTAFSNHPHADTSKTRHRAKAHFDQDAWRKRSLSRAANVDHVQKTLGIKEGPRPYASAHMEERARRRLAGHFARKHGGKIIAGGAALAAAGTAGVAYGVHRHMANKRKREEA